MIKYAAASIWALASCFFLWFFAYVSTWPSSPGQSLYLIGLDDLFVSFVMFTLVVTLGGASYYVMSKILEAPYNAADRANWIKLLIFLKLTLVIEFSVLMVLIYIRDFYTAAHDGVVFMAIFLALWITAMFMMRHAVQQMRNLRVLADVE
ncbi:hypothetical protein [Rheinheimera maricola]|uniref:DUF2975 domain-containing protein n=1 Tax=Rheinheimera maricola TaxID=2793282 RepID=A0ABS7X9D3_9GAMM|nr:hypothetical protein [Rheinheimera maricola]MBZ9612161.1 hypothetical protein [Rheinheimera maricola]